jgi:hypothetical protein
MKLKVTHFKSPRACLAELEKFIRDGQHLRTGKPLRRFDGLRSRELLANWLICAVINAGRSRPSLTFTTDPHGGDGILYDMDIKKSWPTEHVLAPPTAPNERRDIATLIVDAISKKQAKGGAAYASGKTLILFLDAGLGEWFPNRVARQRPQIDFDDVWVVGLYSAEAEGYTYGVTRLDLSLGHAPIWLIHINETFDAWEIKRLQ